MKRFLILFLIINFLFAPVFAMEFDTSIDDDIRKNYNPAKIEEDVALPGLPKILKESIVSTQSQSQKYTQTTTKSLHENYAVLKQGTKIKVKLQNSISDRTKKGTRIKFVSQYPVSTTYFTLPMGTVFNGEIIASHKPQITGNGGLIVINVNSVILNGEPHPINAFVTKANHKKIFFNNIKGKRKYFVSMIKSTKPGRHFFRKMLSVSANLARDGSSIFVAPFSLVLGVLAFGSNTFASPALALFYKGDFIYLNAGSNFEIKLTQDVFIY